MFFLEILEGEMLLVGAIMINKKDGVGGGIFLAEKMVGNVYEFLHSRNV